jgi:hypothetical protein
LPADGLPAFGWGGAPEDMMSVILQIRAADWRKAQILARWNLVSSQPYPMMIELFNSYWEIDRRESKIKCGPPP